MKIPFYKYHGTGNDFVIIDQTVNKYLTDSDQELIERLCDRRFGIGGDGLMLLEKSHNSDFKMIYFNSDGRTTSMCGNGGRCIVSLAARLDLFREYCTFEAIDGIHEAAIHPSGIVELKMNDVSTVIQNDADFILDTGSPHFVRFVEEIESVDMVSEGKKIRYSDHYKAEGVNVNYVQKQEDILVVRTYERGVENETLSCGTGVVAAAIASAMGGGQKGPQDCDIKTIGGRLSVSFERMGDQFKNIWLKGPAEFVFEGVYSMK